MHVRLLPAEKVRWYTHDVGLPLLGTLLVVGFGRIVLPEGLSRLGLLLYLGAIGLGAYIATACLSSFTLKWLRQRIVLLGHKA